MTTVTHSILRPALALIWSMALSGCGLSRPKADPAIEFTRVPEAGTGSPDRFESIEGRVMGASSSDRLVLYALSGIWWVQPVAQRPFTDVQADSSWNTLTHPGAVYAALLVDASYRPPLKMVALPKKGGPILAVATVKGAPARSPPPVLQFSGYQWEVRQSSAEDSASGNSYDPGNATIDENGFLHLRVSRQRGQWANAEIKLSRSLGYGSYRFVVQDVSLLEPAAVFAVFTWDDHGPARAMHIEVSRWGQPEDKNAQFVVQPWDVPANTVRFLAPQGTLTYWMKWEPGRVAFQTVRGSSPKLGTPVVAEHAFTSGVPVAGSERLQITLYVYDHSPRPMQNEAEMILESFEFLP